MANPISSVSSSLQSAHIIQKGPVRATQAQTQLPSGRSYLKTPSRSANRAQLQVKLRPLRKARKAQANQNPAKPNKNASL
jgi:hypothetical protein